MEGRVTVAEVKIRSVWKKYGDVEAVKGLTLDCEDGEFLALLGPSGCGKTSTLRMIAGLEEITSGDIFIGDRRVNDLLPRERNISLAFENYALYPPLSVFENVAFPLKAKGYSSEVVERKVSEILKTFGIWELRNESPMHLSGGQQQLVSLCRCLVKDVDVYLLDEAISHLDTELRAYMRSILKGMHQDMGKTFVYVTHDQLEAMAMADKIAVMNFGELQQVDTPENIYEHPHNLFVAGFIGEPPMNFLRGKIVMEGKYYFVGEGYRIDLSQGLLDFQLVKPGREYILGMRPSEIDIYTTPGEDEELVEARVFVYEPQADHAIVTLLLGEDKVIIETPDVRELEPDTKVFLRFNLEKLRFFDPVTGDSVLQIGYKGDKR